MWKGNNLHNDWKGSAKIMVDQNLHPCFKEIELIIYPNYMKFVLLSILLMPVSNKLLCLLSDMVLISYKEAIPSSFTCCSVYFKRSEMGNTDFKLKTAYLNIPQVYAAVHIT